VFLIGTCRPDRFRPGTGAGQRQWERIAAPVLRGDHAGAKRPGIRRSCRWCRPPRSTSYLQPRRAVGDAVLRAARQRGQIRPDADVDVLSDQLWGACMYRLMTGAPLTEDFARELVRNLLKGVHA
jgi:hypothetical protein